MAAITAEKIATALGEIKHQTREYEGKITAEPGDDHMTQIAFKHAHDAFAWAGEYGLEGKVRFASPVTALAERAVLLLNIADYIAIDD